VAYDLLEPETKSGYDIIEPEAKGYDVIEPIEPAKAKPVEESRFTIPRVLGESTTKGGGRVPVASLAETLVEPIEAAGETLTHPSPIPTPFEVKKEDSPLTAIGKEVVNLGVGIPQFFTSALGVEALAAGTVAPTAVAALFTADLLHSLGQKVQDTYKNWSEMSPGQKAGAITEMAGTGVFAGLTGAHTVKGVKAKLEAITPIETPAEAGQRAELIDRLNTVAPITAAEVAKQGGTENALRQQKSAEEMLRAQGAGEGGVVELQGVGAQNAKPEIAAATEKETAPTVNTEGQAVSEVVTKPSKSISPQKASQEFDAMVMEHAAERGWARNPESLYAETGGGGQQGTASIQARILKSKELKIARRNAAIEAGIDPDSIDTPTGRAAALEKLREHVENDFGEAVTKPKLLPGEKQGDLISSTQTEDFALAGEKGIDVERAAKLKANQEKAKAEKEALEAKQQLAIDDWVSATMEKPFTETGMELGAGIPIPKFANRKMSPLDKVTAQHSGKLQKSMDEARRAQKEIKRDVPTERRQNAISIWREAGGDVAVLKQWETNAKQKWMRDVARDAQSLTPKEVAVANKAIAAFSTLETRGNTFDVLGSHRENYVPHVWYVKRPGTGFGTGMLQQRFRFSKARTFATFFEGDQAGFKPKTLAIGKLLPAYIHEMNKVIADRQFVRDLANETAADGRPLVAQRGHVKVVEGDEGKAVLVQPRALRGEDTADYKTMENQPALHDWIWQSKDTNGNPVFVKADLALHPDAYRRVNAMLGQSALRQWYHDPVGGMAQIPRAIVRGIDVGQAAMKREMFGFLAPFHQVQEGTHGIGHMVNPFFGIPKIDLRNPAQFDAANHGLMLLPDRASSRVYLEGVGAKTSLLSRGIRKIPKAGEALADVIDGYQDYLFHQYIPGLKFKTYEAMLKRNTKLYADELASGEMTLADVKITSAEQANAAYGHLNYALLDRNPTIQHLIQLGALAPDFLEARTRFAGQAVKGLTSKVGHEQLKAVAILAAAQAGTAFILSNMLGVPYDPKHPFELVYKGRRYAMRSVPEDIYSLLKDTRQFIYGRVNPLIVKGGIQALTELNYRGEKVTPLETFTELLAGYIPITLRSMPGLRELTESSRNNPTTPIQQLAGSLGLRISRYSPISETYKLAGEWKDKQKLPKDKGSYPISKYQQLRYALEDGDLDRAKGEYLELKKTMTADKIAKGFKESVNHPFTGSKAQDEQFAKSLSGYNKELYKHALKTRQQILNAFEHVK